MRIGMIAPPFIAVPPARYGGTELFIANLVRELQSLGHSVTLYANGDSRVTCALKWRYPHAEWPVANQVAAQLKNADHTAWAIRDAAASVDLLHLNDVTGVPLTQFTDLPAVVTIHHPHEPVLSDLYLKYPDIDYVAISESQAALELMPKLHVVHHGIDLSRYTFRASKDDYVVFLGRMAPCKGAHLAIEAAARAGIRLKLAGEVQPTFQDYWDNEVRPRVDGRDIEYVGEADHLKKNDLLSSARALLFPIQWEEPFGLVLIEAMACGTPVLAFDGGAVSEVVSDGVSGWICADVDDMADRIAAPGIAAADCREWAAERFSSKRMAADYVAVYESAVARVTGATAEAEGVTWKM